MKNGKWLILFCLVIVGCVDIVPQIPDFSALHPVNFREDFADIPANCDIARGASGQIDIAELIIPLPEGGNTLLVLWFKDGQLLIEGTTHQGFFCTMIFTNWVILPYEE